MNTLRQPRRILITGASRGIGRAAAEILARQGHRVVLAARDEDQLLRLQTSLRQEGRETEVVAVDVTQEDSVQRCAEMVLAGGPLDVLVNNAGSLDQATFLAQERGSRRSEMDVNYFGALNMTQAFLPSFIQRGEGGVVNVSSMLGSVGTPTTANYCASKAALEAFSSGLRGEVARHGVAVTVFVAPHTQTDLGAGAQFRGLQSLPADWVASELVRAIDRAPRRYAAGQHLRLGLRLAAWFPAFMEKKLTSMVEHLLVQART